MHDPDHGESLGKGPSHHPGLKLVGQVGARGTKAGPESWTAHLLLSLSADLAPRKE